MKCEELLAALNEYVDGFRLNMDGTVFAMLKPFPGSDGAGPLA